MRFGLAYARRSVTCNDMNKKNQGKKKKKAAAKQGRDVFQIDFCGDERLKAALAKEAKRQDRSRASLIRRILTVTLLDGYIDKLPL